MLTLSSIAAISFQICVANRYKLNKKLRKLKAKSEQNQDDIRIKSQASQAQVSVTPTALPQVVSVAPDSGTDQIRLR